MNIMTTGNIKEDWNMNAETAGLYPVKEKDADAIIECIDKEIDITIDEYGRVFNEGGIYIADVEVEDDE